MSLTAEMYVRFDDQRKLGVGQKGSTTADLRTWCIVNMKWIDGGTILVLIPMQSIHASLPSLLITLSPAKGICSVIPSCIINSKQGE